MYISQLTVRVTDSTERHSLPRRGRVTRVRGKSETKSLNMSLDTSPITHGKPLTHGLDL